MPDPVLENPRLAEERSRNIEANITRAAVEKPLVATAAEATSPNFALGENAGTALAAKSETNTLYGVLAGKSLTTGKNNTAVGEGALEFATTGGSNTAAGESAGQGIIEGKQNTALGQGAMASGAAGNNNVAVGNEALYATKAEGNTATGYRAGFALTTGAANVAIGKQALTAGTTSGNNVAVGNEALKNAAVQNGNTAVGSEAGEENEGSGNVFLGDAAGKAEKGSNKLYIANNPTTAIIKGVMSATAASNELELGTVGGKVGLFATTPATKPEVTGGTVTTKQLAEALATIGLVKVN